jgi:hypothetical protein
MFKELVMQLRYLGVISQSGYVEYGFRIEDKDKNARQVILTITDALFRENNLKFQEAPDLCYQKVLVELEKEDMDSRMPESIPITAVDIAHYRGLHPNSKLRKFAPRDTK